MLSELRSRVTKKQCLVNLRINAKETVWRQVGDTYSNHFKGPSFTSDIIALKILGGGEVLEGVLILFKKDTHTHTFQKSLFLKTLLRF